MFKGSRSSVAGLFSRGSPPAVAFFVVAIVVFPIERLSGRSFPHVGKEVYEGTPLLANRDAATAVVSVTRGFRIAASLDHLFPSVIDRRVPLAMYLARTTARACMFAHELMG